MSPRGSPIAARSGSTPRRGFGDLFDSAPRVDEGSTMPSAAGGGAYQASAPAASAAVNNPIRRPQARNAISPREV